MLRGIPLLAGLADTSAEDRRLAGYELLVTLVISTSPLWLGSLGPWLRGDSSYLIALLANVSGGELFLYAASFLAPVMYIVLEKPPAPRLAFPTTLSHSILAVVGLLICAFVFGFQRTAAEVTSTAVKLSMVLFVGSFCLLYLATVYRNMRAPRPDEMFKKSEQDLMAALQKSR